MFQNDTKTTAKTEESGSGEKPRNCRTENLQHSTDADTPSTKDQSNQCYNLEVQCSDDSADEGSWKEYTERRRSSNALAQDTIVFRDTFQGKRHAACRV